jgi:hypothetical protein
MELKLLCWFWYLNAVYLLWPKYFYVSFFSNSVIFCCICIVTWSVSVAKGLEYPYVSCPHVKMYEPWRKFFWELLNSFHIFVHHCLPLMSWSGSCRISFARWKWPRCSRLSCTSKAFTSEACYIVIYLEIFILIFLK